MDIDNGRAVLCCDGGLFIGVVLFLVLLFLLLLPVAVVLLVLAMVGIQCTIKYLGGGGVESQ